MSRVKERSSRGLQYAIVQGARIGDRGGSPCGERWYDIEGSPVYTTPMRERGIEPRSLPWRGSGLPLTDSRTLFEIRRTDRIHESIGRRANVDDTGLTRRWATNERREHFGECDTTTLHPRPVGWGGRNRTSDLSLEVSPAYSTPMRHPRIERGLAVWRTVRATFTPMPRCCRPDSNRDPLAEDEAWLPLHHSSDAVSRSRTGARRSKDVDA